mmetsp:Transcript_79204/g.183785  ORF Transcript_79204/g.183785 Transcript_79204/m.183785 type:complete len:239 (-) Transcript_79204:208-924(-)
MRTIASAVLTWLSVVAAEESSLPSWELVATHFGELAVREFGPQDGPLAVLVHGMMDSDFIHNEWNAMAKSLADEGFHVLIPNFHSTRQLSPGVLTPDAFQELLLRTLLPRNSMVPTRYHSSVRPRVVLMGKSWGSSMAAQAAAALDEVVGAALVVPLPAVASFLPSIKGQLVLCLAKDDPVVDFSEVSHSFRAALGEREVSWVEAEHGGHQVLGEFVPPLLAFAKKVRSAFIHESREL